MGKELPQSSRISSKGQVTVPIAVRKRLGLRAGDRVEFAQQNGNIVLRPARAEGENPFAESTGILGNFPGGVDEVNAWISELRDDQEGGSGDW